MKRTPTILLIVASALCAVLVLGRLQAQPDAPVAKAPPTRVGVCNVVGIFNKSKEAAAMTKEFDARKRKIKAEAEDQAKKIADAQKALRDDFEVGTPDYQDEVKRIQQMMVKLRVWDEMQDAEVKSDRYVMTRVLHNRILAAIEAEAKLRGIDVVVHKTTPPPSDPSIVELLNRIRSKQVLYVRDELDLTAAVLKRIDDAYAKEDGKKK